jgi:hypothetical protein
MAARAASTRREIDTGLARCAKKPAARPRGILGLSEAGYGDGGRASVNLHCPVVDGQQAVAKDHRSAVTFPKASSPYDGWPFIDGEPSLESLAQR